MEKITIDNSYPLPITVAASRSITGSAKIVYAMLLGSAKGGDTADITQVEISEGTTYTIKTIHQLINQLVAARLISVIDQGVGEPNRYKILPIAQANLGVVRSRQGRRVWQKALCIE